MKRLFCTLLLLLFLVPSLPAIAHDSNSAQQISQRIQQAVPTPFGYVDHTSYSMKTYFSDMSFVIDSHIVVCADTTNFNEFGVFLVRDSDVKLCQTRLKAYLKKRKTAFCNGIVYDIEQYPKFEDAAVYHVGEYVFYTILNKADAQKALGAVKQSSAQ